MVKITGEQAKRNYNKHVQQQSHFTISDKVWLQHDNIPTMAPSKKLVSKFLGPFVITTKLSNLVYHLKLPKTLHIHDVFHVSLLEPYHQDTIPGRKKTPPPPNVTPKENLEWEVQSILDSRLIGRGKKLHYFVAWQGYGPEENFWEPVGNLKNAPNIVKQFHCQYLQALGSKTRT